VTVEVTTTSIGTIVVEECILPIEKVQFRDGLVFITARKIGGIGMSVKLTDRSHFRLHGVDGTLVGSGRLSLPREYEVNPRENLTLELPLILEFIGKSAWP